MPEAQVPSQRRSRSRSPQPSPGPPPSRDYVVSSSRPSTSLLLSSPPPSRSAIPRRRVDLAANTALTPARGHPVDPKSYTSHTPVVAAVDDCDTGGSPSPAPQSNTWLGIGGSTLGQRTTNPCSITQHSANLPCHSNVPHSMPHSPHKNTGMFMQARDFTVTGTFVDGNVTYNTAPANIFMEKLLEKTILGAEFDSSDRDPPPRCHPGTRLAVLERCLSFISNCDGVKKMRWVFGAAGVGKSAIMQSVAESPELPVDSHVSIFFSINGRDDGTKAILTLSYQFAAKFDSYRQVIEREITRDPSLFRSSMAKQFDKLIVEPFIHNVHVRPAGRILVIIDGLDECKDHWTQQELLRLISELCLMYPLSPLVWLIASRPEQHITSFFSRRKIVSVYEKEEMPVNSNEARADVERFLREKFTEIKEESDSLDSHWPEERDFWKLTGAAGGLFAYAYTVINYISDSRIGSPASQLSDVLHIIDEHPMTDLSREEHPMALLDALYERILSNVPDRIMVHTRKLLLALASGWGSVFRYHVRENFIVLCNWLGITADEAYAALNCLRSVLYVPRREKAHKYYLKALHKSFIDYISDFSRSRFSPNILDEARHLKTQCIFRILNEVPRGIGLSSGEVPGLLSSGKLASGPDSRDKISLFWLVEKVGGWDDKQTRLHAFILATEEVLKGMEREDPEFQSEFCIRFLTAVYSDYFPAFPYYQLLNAVFDESRRLEFIAHGTLQRISSEAITFKQMYECSAIKLQFRRPAMTLTNLFDPWNSSCQHEREGEWGEGKADNWTTSLRESGFFSSLSLETRCVFCFERLERQLEKWKTHSPDDTVLVLFTPTEHCCVQARFVDPEDGMSEWIYSFWYKIPWEERKKYGCTV